MLSHFTLDELVAVTPRRVLKPRTALLKSGESLLIGGVARLDITSISGPSNVLLTTFVNEQLPLEVMPTEEVPGFYEKWLGTRALVVPRGGPERMSQWAGLGSGRRFEMKGRRDEGCCDIVLSSIGWVMVTSERDLVIKWVFKKNRKFWTSESEGIPFSKKNNYFKILIRNYENSESPEAFWKVKFSDFSSPSHFFHQKKRTYKKMRNL